MTITDRNVGYDGQRISWSWAAWYRHRHSIISEWIALPYACRSVIDGRVGNVEMRPMTIASQFNTKSPIRALALTAKIQPTIGGVKSSVPPSTTSETINSTPSKTAKAAANAAK